ncbi:MAG: peptidase U32 family protein [Bacteroidales bacterium]
METGRPYPLELLAPARDLNTGVAAINYGADAVYIGAPAFGARAAATNSVADIEKLANYAHIFKARVYVTLNTLLRDDEIEQATKLAWDVYRAGADALIIQDFGLVEAGLPPIPLHASTQMHNTSPEKVVFLEKCGFRQVVLARETPLEEIRRIRAQTTVPLEFFVHGALCVCYSGHCHLSKHLTGRSANRGACAQPCRSYYDIVSATGHIMARQAYALSPKDLNLSAHLEELIEAGISSFKIEGRLKDVEYVKNITAYYRKLLDEYLLQHPEYARASSGQSAVDFQPNPAKSFNRGFTDYFLNQRPQQLISRIPRSLGEPLGKISQIDKKGFVIEPTTSVKPGDGLVIINPDGSWGGSKVISVNKGWVRLLNDLKIKPGAEVFRNEDGEFSERLRKSFAQRKIRVQVHVNETAEGFSLELFDEDGVHSETPMAMDKIPARNPENARQTILNSLAKDKDSPFALVLATNPENLGQWHVLASGINELRRRAIENHLNQRITQFRPERVNWQPTSHAYPSTDFLPFLEITNNYQIRFLEHHGVKAEWLHQLPPPPLMVTRHCLRYTFGVCPRHQHYDASRDPALLINNRRKLYLSYDCQHCVMMIHDRPTKASGYQP